MNYKGILTEEAAKGFKEEGIITVILLLYKDINICGRSIELDLNDLDDKKTFSISGKTAVGQAAMEETFGGSIVGDRKWYPFSSLVHYVGSSKDIERAMKEVAYAAHCDISDLEWGLIEYER